MFRFLVIMHKAYEPVACQVGTISFGNENSKAYTYMEWKVFSPLAAVTGTVGVHSSDILIEML